MGCDPEQNDNNIPALFPFVKNSFPTISTFMCDRHFGQRMAIRDVFGDGVSIFHYCVHIARNIRANCGPNTTLHKAFWAMLFKRTKAAEDMFVETFERLNNSRKTLFTTELLNSLQSFVPSALDPVLRKPAFLSLVALQVMDIRCFKADTEQKRRALVLLRSLQRAECPDTNVFVLVNTHAIEGYLSGVKRRMNVSPLTLRDVFNAVDMTEPTILASGSPFTTTLPFTIKTVSCSSSLQTG